MNIESFKAAAAASVFVLAALTSPMVSAQTDGDKDGVADSLDDCPYTPTGAKVDRTGCALDEDFDGVADGLDRCNATPLGAVVDGDGCVREQAAATAPVAPPPPPPLPILVPPPAPSAAVDPFSTRPPASSAPIQGYALDSAPTPAQVNSGAVAVPLPAPFPAVPDQVRADLDSRASGKTIVNLPLLRDPSQVPAAPVPAPDFSAPPTPDFSAPPPAPAPELNYVQTPVYLHQRPIVTAPQRRSGDPVVPSTPKIVIPPSSMPTAPLSAPSFNAPLPFSGGAPVDPFSTPLTPAPLKSDWTVAIGSGGEIDGVSEQTLRQAADAIKQAQRENPSLNYEVAGSVNAASNAMSFLTAQGVAISRLRLKATAAADGTVLIRPASE